jgi:hypothetical protein
MKVILRTVFPGSSVLESRPQTYPVCDTFRLPAFLQLKNPLLYKAFYGFRVLPINVQALFNRCSITKFNCLKFYGLIRHLQVKVAGPQHRHWILPAAHF